MQHFKKLYGWHFVLKIQLNMFEKDKNKIFMKLSKNKTLPRAEHNAEDM